ncbi:MAG TPA: hypothetical protein VK514_08600 [Candidatus Acidoferrum sp.]|nr:hypothetical protein [Candidatus Acidoferrum sp.]
MSQEIRKTEGPRDETDDELTTADLAGTNQPTPKDDEAPRIENERRSAERLDGTDVRTDTSFTGDASRVRSRGTAAAPARALEQETGPLFSGSEANDLRGKWDAIQVGFVDEPRRAVEQADSLVAGTMKRLAEVFAEERNMLEKQWDKGENVSTEDLRLALRRYRSFFSRLLSV